MNYTELRVIRELGQSPETDELFAKTLEIKSALAVLALLWILEISRVHMLLSHWESKFRSAALLRYGSDFDTLGQLLLHEVKEQNTCMQLAVWECMSETGRWTDSFGALFANAQVKYNLGLRGEQQVWQIRTMMRESASIAWALGELAASDDLEEARTAVAGLGAALYFQMSGTARLPDLVWYHYGPALMFGYPYDGVPKTAELRKTWVYAILAHLPELQAAYRRGDAGLYEEVVYLLMLMMAAADNEVSGELLHWLADNHSFNPRHEYWTTVIPKENFSEFGPLAIRFWMMFGEMTGPLTARAS